MDQITNLQQQIAYLLIDKIKKNEITTDRVTEIALEVENILPNFLSQEQLNDAYSLLITIPELSEIRLTLND